MTARDRNETAPGGPAASRQTVWPTVLGAFALVSAAMTFLGGANQLLETLGSGGATTSQPATSQPAVAPTTAFGTNMLIALLLSIWLLWAGIGLIRRRRWAGKSMVNWAITKILWLGVGTTMILMGLFRTLQEQGPPAGWTTTGYAAVAVLGVVLSLLPGLVPPVFVLLWFSRRWVRNEMATWT